MLGCGKHFDAVLYIYIYKQIIIFAVVAWSVWPLKDQFRYTQTQLHVFLRKAKMDCDKLIDHLVAWQYRSPDLSCPMSYEIETEIAQDNSEGRYANCFEGTKKRHVAGQCVRPQEPAPVSCRPLEERLNPKQQQHQLIKQQINELELQIWLRVGQFHKNPSWERLISYCQHDTSQPTTPPPPPKQSKHSPITSKLENPFVGPILHT